MVCSMSSLLYPGSITRTITVIPLAEYPNTVTPWFPLSMLCAIDCSVGNPGNIPIPVRVPLVNPLLSFSRGSQLGTSYSITSQSTFRRFGSIPGNVLAIPAESFINLYENKYALPRWLRCFSLASSLDSCDFIARIIRSISTNSSNTTASQSFLLPFRSVLNSSGYKSTTGDSLSNINHCSGRGTSELDPAGRTTISCSSGLYGSSLLNVIFSNCSTPYFSKSLTIGL
ncbi:hypothetical protein AX774_g4491 [Zancudomyces culisetae]|uniref:Uncharacterized protein n=1 Tax=Zancudomyces culisetae TaxID=1213189 RepID=A0A1R1PM41_ZANCU|nr:hypothetical protein AX774_g4491 [Zancudomyces culisetae]|eukprot:OMH82040.1 hypothetical protein AX774_g4491 [Zancudomyces culisetae]